MSQDKGSIVWIQTPLSEFGHKCIMNKHDLCTELSCGCICHQAKFNLTLENQKTPLSITENITWLA